MNREWHKAHRLVRSATLDQRITWHLAHAAVCGCREMPDSIKRELEHRGIAVPSVASLK